MNMSYLQDEERVDWTWILKPSVANKVLFGSIDIDLLFSLAMVSVRV